MQGSTTIIDLTGGVEFAASLAEPCAGFVPLDASPVCAECGWLDDEHATAVGDGASGAAPRVRYPSRRRRFAAAS